MGLKAIDLTPFQVTPITPAAKGSMNKFFRVSRTDTAATLKAALPADSTIVGITLFGSSNSNAGTTATLTVTASNNTGTISTGSVNLLTGGATTADVQMSNLPNLEANPPQGDIQITAQYAETGTASSAGGPWVVRVFYVR